MSDALNLTPTVVWHVNTDGSRYRAETETLAALDKRAGLEDAFADWIWTDPDRAARLEQLYNDRFNSVVLADWDGSHLTHLPGLAASFTPHPHQLDAVWRILASDSNVLLGHRVGAGKTATMVIAGQELRRTGQITKPLYLVPNHMLDQFAAEFRQLYPMADVLVATKDELAAAARRAFVARCATGDWAAVVMTHSTFSRVPVSAATELGFIRDEMDRFTAAADAARETGATKTVKAIERAAARWTTRLQELTDITVDVGNVTFEQLGVDYLFVDEAHGYKGLPFTTSLPLAGSQSKKAADMVMKLDWLRSAYPSKTVTFATGTPIANSLAELWVLQRYLTPDLLRNTEMEAFDSWAGTFARPVTRLELAPEGGRFRMHTRVAAFDNVPELLTTFRSFCDLLAPDDLGSLHVPNLVDDSAVTVVVPATPGLAGLIGSLGERADLIRTRNVTPDIDNMLKVCNDGRLASLDLRLVGDDQPAGTGKIEAAARHIHQLWDRYRNSVYVDAAGQPSPILGGLQVVFCDKGTPSDTFNVYDTLRDRLEVLGLDPGRVRFIHEAGSDAAKERLFNDCRSGAVAVLIGSTEKMGVGTNIQTRMVALHHLDAPWRPADIEQREGRILRHGNQNRAVQIVRYVTEASFDPYMWQTLERKARFIAQLMTPATPADAGRHVDDLDSDVVLSYAEIKAVATGNPTIREHAEVAAEHARLTRLADTHTVAQRALPRRIAGLAARVTRLTGDVDRLDLLRRRYVDTRGSNFAYTTPAGVRFSERPAAGQAFIDIAATVTTRDPHADKVWVPAGRLGGVDWEYERQRERWGVDQISVRVTGDTSSFGWDSATLNNAAPHVVIRQLEAHARQIPDRHATNLTDLANTVEQHDRATQALGQPFSHRDRLNELAGRLHTLEQALSDTLAEPSPFDPTTADVDGDDLDFGIGI